MIGGWKSTPTFFEECNRFDTVEKKWEEIAGMQEERGGLFVVIVIVITLFNEGKDIDYW